MKNSTQTQKKADFLAIGEKRSILLLAIKLPREADLVAS
jgi:hypothetical protein